MFKTIILSSACLLVAAPAFAQDIQPPLSAPAAALQPTATSAVLVITDDAKPRVPEGFAASFAAPERDAGGAYRTPNRDLSPAEVTWHVRAALNVAALGCRDEASAYNAMLAAEKAPLAAADAAAQATEKARFGEDWEAQHDGAMTKLYNFWAQPPAQEAFCAAADTVLREAAAVEPADFPAFAASALPRLEAPFLAAFARFDGYRGELAQWQARHAPAPVLAPVVIASADTPAIVPDPR